MGQWLHNEKANARFSQDAGNVPGFFDVALELRELGHSRVERGSGELALDLQRACELSCAGAGKRKTPCRATKDWPRKND